MVTGEWFLEERAKRFERMTIPYSDVVKQSILTSVPGKQHALFTWHTDYTIYVLIILEVTEITISEKNFI